MFKILIGIQARSTSQRFPNKMLAPINGKPMIEHVVDRCFGALNYKARIYNTVVALLIPDNDPLKQWNAPVGVQIIEGDELDLITRYQAAIDLIEPDAIIRVTGDEPCLPTKLITTTMDQLSEFDYVSNTVVRTYYEGYDIQGCSRKAWDEFFSQLRFDREHPFKPFDMNEWERDRFEAAGFKWSQLINSNNPNQVHLSVDVPEDIQRLERFLRENKI